MKLGFTIYNNKPKGEGTFTISINHDDEYVRCEGTFSFNENGETIVNDGVYHSKQGLYKGGIYYGNFSAISENSSIENFKPIGAVVFAKDGNHDKNLQGRYFDQNSTEIALYDLNEVQKLEITNEMNNFIRNSQDGRVIG